MPLPLELYRRFPLDVQPPHPVVGQGANTNCSKNTPNDFLSSPARGVNLGDNNAHLRNGARKCARLSSRERKKKLACCHIAETRWGAGGIMRSGLRSVSFGRKVAPRFGLWRRDHGDHGEGERGERLGGQKTWIDSNWGVDKSRAVACPPRALCCSVPHPRQTARQLIWPATD